MPMHAHGWGGHHWGGGWSPGYFDSGYTQQVDLAQLVELLQALQQVAPMNDQGQVPVDPSQVDLTQVDPSLVVVMPGPGLVGLYGMFEGGDDPRRHDQEPLLQVRSRSRIARLGRLLQQPSRVRLPAEPDGRGSAQDRPWRQVGSEEVMKKRRHRIAQKTHLGDASTCQNISGCTHPDHVYDGKTTCEDRSVACSDSCPCCLTPPVFSWKWRRS